MNINNLPIEIRRLIALQIRDRWKRHDFIKALGNGLEEYHYGNKYKRPPEWVRTFNPITIFPKYEVNNDMDVYHESEITLELPINEDKVHKIKHIYKRYLFNQHSNVISSLYLGENNHHKWLMFWIEDLAIYRKVGHMRWEKVNAPEIIRTNM